MGVSAVQTLLVSVHHGFPVETARVLQAAAVGSRGEVHARERVFQPREVVGEGRGEG